MPEKTITASCEFNGHNLTDILVINPGGWFGKAWLIELGGSYTPLFIVVEADSVSEAIDELSDNETFGHQIHVSDDDLADYAEDDRHYDGSGRVIDLEHVMVHGREGTEAVVDRDDKLTTGTRHARGPCRSTSPASSTAIPTA